MDRRYFDEYLGNALYTGRVVRRLSQEQFVDKANEVWITKYNTERKKGCSRSVYARYESGDVSMPFGFFKASCEVLHIDWVKTFKDAQDYELKMLTTKE